MGGADEAVSASLVGFVPEIVVAFGVKYIVVVVASVVVASFDFEEFGTFPDGDLEQLCYNSF